MASEKIVKAYRLAGDATLDPADLRHHPVVAAFFQSFLRRSDIVRRWRVSGYAVAYQRRRILAIAAMIDKLAPPVDAMRQPRNTEYPWEFAGQVTAPVHEPFADLGAQSLELLRFLSVLQLALQAFDELA